MVESRLGGISALGSNELGGSKCAERGVGALFQGFPGPCEPDRARRRRATNERIRHSDPNGDPSLPSIIRKRRGDRFPDRNTRPLRWIRPRIVRVLGTPRP